MNDKVCNLCSESLIPEAMKKMDFECYYGLVDAKVVGGYSSYHLLDLNTYTFSLCEKCLRELFIKCKVKPDIIYTSLSGAEEKESYDEDFKYYQYRVWQDNGGSDKAFADGKCNFVKDCNNNAVYMQLINDSKTKNISCEDHKELHRYTNSALALIK